MTQQLDHKEIITKVVIDMRRDEKKKNNKETRPRNYENLELIQLTHSLFYSFYLV